MSALQVRLSVVTLFLAIVLLGQEANAQYAPTPKSAPRTPVHREMLNGKTGPSIPASREIAGKANFIDAERLKIGDMEMRLYGVVPPQMGASYGPQARAQVDAMAQGEVTCRIQDRARDGQYMAVCKNGSGLDFGMELLRRGLAATARGTIQGSDLAPSYLAAEQAAQIQRLGIWSSTLPGALSDKVIKEAVSKVEAAKAEAIAKAEADAEAKIKEAGAKTEAAQKLIERADKVSADGIVLPAGTLVEPIDAVKPVLPPAKPEPKGMEMGPTAAEVQALLSKPAPAVAAQADPQIEDVAPEIVHRGWLERYQLLTTGLIGLLGAFSLAGALLLRQSRDKRYELRALAAALRGELMAARSICLARLAKINHENEEKNVVWPRLRTLVFQAYVGRLGHLGAELARQISSIYGQASDYAAYYVGTESRSDTASKKQALQTLVHHIEEVMPRLTQIERVGVAPRPATEALAAPRSPSMLLARVLGPVAATIERHLPSLGAPAGKSLPAPEKNGAPIAQPRSPLWDVWSEAKDDATVEHRSPTLRALHRAVADARALAETKAAQAKDQPAAPVSVADEDDGTVVLKKDMLQNVEPEIAQAVTQAAEQGEAESEPVAELDPVAQALQKADAIEAAAKAKAEAAARIEAKDEDAAEETTADPAQDQAKESPLKNPISPPAGAKMPERHVEPVALARLEAAIAASRAGKGLTAPKAKTGPVAKPAASSGINFAAPIFEKLSRIKDMASAQMDRLKPQPLDDLLPDYANLTEEELEALSYAEAYLAACTPKKERKAG